jgi:hypothetical protein
MYLLTKLALTSRLLHRPGGVQQHIFQQENFSKQGRWTGIFENSSLRVEAGKGSGNYELSLPFYALFFRQQKA